MTGLYILLGGIVIAALVLAIFAIRADRKADHR